MNIQNYSNQPIEQVFSYPLPFKLGMIDNKVSVEFGESDGIKIGHILLNYNQHGKNPKNVLEIPSFIPDFRSGWIES